MNTKDIGDKTEAMVLAALLQGNKTVLTPFGDNQRYDLVIDEKGKFIRIQCKTGKLKNGGIYFKAYSSYGPNGSTIRGYKGEADLFGVYCPNNDKVYLVPINEVGNREVVLRIEKPKNNQVKKIRWAHEYILG